MSLHVNVQKIKRIRVRHFERMSFSTVDLIMDEADDAEVSMFLNGPNHKRSALLVGQIISESEGVELDAELDVDANSIPGSTTALEGLEPDKLLADEMLASSFNVAGSATGRTESAKSSFEELEREFPATMGIAAVKEPMVSLYIVGPSGEELPGENEDDIKSTTAENA